jgi:hypothetical protein
MLISIRGCDIHLPQSLWRSNPFHLNQMTLYFQPQFATASEGSSASTKPHPASIAEKPVTSSEGNSTKPPVTAESQIQPMTTGIPIPKLPG